VNKVVAFVKSSWEEISKEVTWPPMRELQASSGLVLVASIIFALLVGLIDFAFENSLNLFYSSF
jgi:preprotein translocase subunit SecE